MTKASENQRFSYVKYDAQSQSMQEEFKAIFEQAERLGNELPEGRAKSLFLTYLEIAYMWTGKAIRDEQIKRDATTEHQPERGSETPAEPEPANGQPA